MTPGGRDTARRPAAGRPSLQDKRKEHLLQGLRAGLSVGGAAAAAGIARSTAYAWRDADEDFAAAWADAIEDGTDRLEDVAMQRATEKSDRLILAILRARRPERWGSAADSPAGGADTIVVLPAPARDAESWLEMHRPAGSRREPIDVTPGDDGKQ